MDYDDIWVDYDDIGLVLSDLWVKRSLKVDWDAFEVLMDKILQSTMTDSQKVRASKECLDVFTRRGHFPPNQYLNDVDE